MSDSLLGTRTVVQVAIVVRDIETKAEAWAEVLGTDVPAARLTGPKEESHIRYRGASTDGRAKLAFFDLGQVRLELIEPVGGPSTWQEFLDVKGEGIHHIAFFVEGMDEVVQRLQSRGMEPVQRGDYTGGRYAYVDASDRLGAILELLENF